MAHHKQVRIMSSDRKMFALVDEGMSEIIQLLWSLGVSTQFSCESQKIGGQAYILMPFRSARRLEKIIYRGIKNGAYSQQTLEVFQSFAMGEFRYEASLFRIVKKNGRKHHRTVWKRRRLYRMGRPYSVERTFSNLYGARTTYRWPSFNNPEVLIALKEVVREHQK